MRKFSLIALLLGIVAGCETYYRVPTDMQIAKVRFSSDRSDQRLIVTSFETAQCDIGSTGGIIGVVGGYEVDPLGKVPKHIKETGNTLGMVGYNEVSNAKSIERLIPANKV